MSAEHGNPDGQIERAFDNLRADAASIPTDAALRRLEAERPGLTSLRPWLAAAVVLIAVVGAALVFRSTAAPDVDVIAPPDNAEADNSAADAPVSLTGTWEVVGTDEDPLAMLRFEAGDLVGTAACGIFAGSYAQQGLALSVFDLSDEPGGSCSVVLGELFDELKRVDGVTAEGDGEILLVGTDTEVRLRRSRSAGEPVVGAFPETEALLDGEWELSAAPFGFEPGEITASFRGLEVKGRVGCDTYQGRFDVIDGELVLESISRGSDACPEVADTYFDALAVARVVDGDATSVLTLSGEGVDLTFTRAVTAEPAQDVTLAGTAWRLVIGGDDRGDLGLRWTDDVTLVFGMVGRLSGRAVCADYDGFYAVTGSSFSVSDLASDSISCDPPQGRYGAALAKATHIAIVDDELIITSVDATVELLFRPQGADTFSIERLRNEVPSGFVQLSARAVRSSDGGWILCDEVAADGARCAGFDVVVLNLDDRTVEAERVTLVGALDEWGRLVVDDRAAPGDSFPGAEGSDVTPSEQDVIEALLAADLSSDALVWHPDGVVLSLGGTWTDVVRTPAALADPAAWVLTPEQGYFAGRDGPFSALDVLVGRSAADVEAFKGPHPHCASPPAPLPDVEFEHQLVIQAAGIDSCLMWFVVDVLFDIDGRVVGVNLDLWEP